MHFEQARKRAMTGDHLSHTEEEYDDRLTNLSPLPPFKAVGRNIHCAAHETPKWRHGSYLMTSVGVLTICIKIVQLLVRPVYDS